MKYTKDEWLEYAKMDDALDAFASEYVFEVTDCNYSINDVFVDVGSDTIAITYDDSCCGCTSSGHMNAPLHYLWLDDWRAALIAAQEEEERMAIQAAEKRAWRREQANEAADKALYLELKERFE